MQVKLVVIAILSTLLLFGSYYYGKSQAKIEYITKVVEVQTQGQEIIKEVYKEVEKVRDRFGNVNEECSYILSFDMRACGM